MENALIVIGLLTTFGFLLNAWHCYTLGQRIDTVHKRLDLTLEDNDLHDFWNAPPRPPRS